MRKAMLLFVTLMLIAFLAVSCGDSSRHITVPPQVSSFAFLSQASSGQFQPVLAKFTNGVFSSAPVLDPSTKQPVEGPIHSILLSPDAKLATVDMWPTTPDAAPGVYYPDIYVANSDGTGTPLNITNNTTTADYYNAHPSFTADGKQVIFLSSRGTSSWYDTMSANSDGTGLKNLTADSDVCHHEAAASPDGKLIAFSGHDHSDAYIYEIWTMNAADGSNLVNVTDKASDAYDTIFDLYPSFTPDSKQIVFSRIDDIAYTINIYRINIDGTNLTQLTTTGMDWYPRYVGEKITFISFRDGNAEVYSMSPDGSNQTRLTNNTVFDSFSADMEAGSSSALEAVKKQATSHPGLQKR